MSTGFTLWIRHSNGQRREIGVGSGDASNASITVLNVKEYIAREDAATPVHRQRLIYKGRILENDRSLADYDIVKGATLFLVKSAAAPTTTTTPSTPPQAQTSSTPSATSPPPMGMPSRTTASPPDMSQNPFANPFGGGMPPAFGGMPTPEQMQQMLNNPSIQNLLDNPDRLGQLLQSSMQHPQMQQLMESNPELRQLWNDPSMMQQAMQMMRNPNMMQQAMRQQDLAMSQLENMPGGFAALSNMYRNVQEPMMEAAAESHAGPSTTTSSGNAAASTEGATGTAMPNPWSTAPPPRATPAASQPPANQPPNPFAAAGGGMPNPWAGGAANPWGMPAPQQQPNMDQMMQMLDNPMVTEMMNNMVQNNPDMLRQMIEAQNPMMAQMFQGNPEMANSFIQNAMNPNNLRQMIQMQQNMGGPNNNTGAGMMPPPNPMMFGNNNPFMMPPPPTGAGGGELDFSSLLQQFQGLNTAAPTGGSPPPQQANPADRYRVQLRSLYDMGFDDEQASLAALQAVNGNLNRAVDHLLSSPPPAPAVSTPPASNQGDASTASAAAEEDPRRSPKDATEKKND